MFRRLHNQSKKVSQGRTPRNRSTGFETLENRQLLSGNPLGALASPNIDSPAYTTAACYPTTGPLLHLAIQPCHLMLGYFDPQDFHDPGIDLDGVKENEGVGPLPSLSSLSSLSSLPASHDRPGFLLAPG